MSYKDVLPTATELKSLRKLHSIMYKLKEQRIVSYREYNEFLALYDRIFILDKYISDFGDTIDRDIERGKK